MDQQSIAVLIGVHIPKAAIVSFRTALAGGVGGGAFVMRAGKGQVKGAKGDMEAYGCNERSTDTPGKGRFGRSRNYLGIHEDDLKSF